MHGSIRSPRRPLRPSRARKRIFSLPSLSRTPYPRRPRRRARPAHHRPPSLSGPRFRAPENGPRTSRATSSAVFPSVSTCRVDCLSKGVRRSRRAAADGLPRRSAPAAERASALFRIRARRSSKAASRFTTRRPSRRLRLLPRSRFPLPLRDDHLALVPGCPWSARFRVAEILLSVAFKDLRNRLPARASIAGVEIERFPAQLARHPPRYRRLSRPP